jgi:hypothetical protein
MPPIGVQKHMAQDPHIGELDIWNMLHFINAGWVPEKGLPPYLF